MLGDKFVLAKKELTEFAGLVESMVQKSIRGLLDREKATLLAVIEQDEPRANARELEIDELCTALIAQYEPKAKELRTLLMILQMNNDLERIGDHAVNIAQSALFLIERPQVKPFKDIPKTTEVTLGMLKDGIDSFVNENGALAKSVCERDNIVDDLKDKIVIELTAIMSADPATIERSLHLLRITSNLERVADLSTNMCEDVLFMTEGRVIKHHREDAQHDQPPLA